MTLLCLSPLVIFHPVPFRVQSVPAHPPLASKALYGLTPAQLCPSYMSSPGLVQALRQSSSPAGGMLAPGALHFLPLPCLPPPA